MPPPAAEAFAEADAVFVGQVECIQPRATRDESGSLTCVTFRVSESWRGVTGGEAAVYTWSDSAGCGVSVWSPMRLLVYASEDSAGRLFMHLCSRTTQASEKIDEDIAEFGRLGFDTLTLVEGPDPNYPPECRCRGVFDLCGSGVLWASVVGFVGLAAIGTFFRQGGGKGRKNVPVPALRGA